MLVSRKSSFFVFLLFAFAVCLSSPPAHSQDRSPPIGPKPVALIAALPLAGPPDEGVRKVLTSVMRLELERQGLQTILFASADEQALVRDLLEGQPRDSAGLLRGLVEFSAAGDRDFLVLGGYTQEVEEIQVDFGIADAEQGGVLGAVSIRAPIDFRLDDVLIRALRELLPMAEGKIAEVARRRADEAALAQVAPPAQGEAGQEGEDGGMAEGAAPAAEGAAPAAEGAAPAAPWSSWSGGSRFRRLEFSIGFAPFIPLGAANATLGVGFVPFAYADYRIPTAAGILGIGLYSGLSLFTADAAGLASYFKYVVPVGVDLRFSGPEALRLGMFVRGGLGAGINASSFEKLPADLRDDLSRVLPYLYGGIGARLGFSEGVGLAVDVLYQTYAYLWRESPGGKVNAEWIMGFMPSLYFFTRL
jgi:hypothetical protein